MPGFGFPKTSRLLKAADYKAVFSKARFKVSCRHFLVLAIGNDRPNSRLGLVIAKKNIALAVQRNRLKRQLRNAFRLNTALLNGLDLVVLTRKDADKLNNKKLNDIIESLWRDLDSKRKHTALSN